MLAVAVLAALGLAAPARAHVSVRPALLSTGADTTLTIELPAALRPGREPTALEVSGPGVRELSTRRAGRLGPGGLGEEPRWRVRVRVETAPGPLPLVLVARYDDGRSVTVRQTLTVLPATAEQESGTPVLPIAVGLAALLAVAVAVLHFKKRSRAAC